MDRNHPPPSPAVAEKTPFDELRGDIARILSSGNTSQDVLEALVQYFWTDAKPRTVPRKGHRHHFIPPSGYPRPVQLLHSEWDVRGGDCMNFESERPRVDTDAVAAEVQELLEESVRPMAACEQVGKNHGLTPRAVYQRWYRRQTRRPAVAAIV